MESDETFGKSQVYSHKRTSMKRLTFLRVDGSERQNADIRISGKHYTNLDNRKIYDVWR